MKVIYSGGYQKDLKTSYKNSWWYRHSGLLDSDAPAAVVTLAKPDGSYDQYLRKFPKVHVIDRKISTVDWHNYKSIFIAGGPTDTLKEEVIKRDFSMDKLDPDVAVLGDSAGAYIMCAYFFTDSDGDPGKNVRFYEGFNANAKNICIAHADNPYYTNALLTRRVEEFAAKHDLEVFRLNENEEKVLEQNT